MEENITLRINSGPKPADGGAVLVLGFAGSPATACEHLEVRLNTKIVQPCAEPHYDSISRTFRKAAHHGWGAAFIEDVRFFALPPAALFDGDNVIEIMPPQVDGHLVWAEIVIQPGEDG
jgi:hypothetical protein